MFFVICTSPSVAHTDFDHANWVEWVSENSLPNTPGRYYLGQDVITDKIWPVPEGVTDLCLNGYVIKQTSPTGVIYIQGTGTTLNICDCNNTKHYFDKDENGLWILNDENTNSPYSIEGGIITGGYDGLGGGICVVRGFFNMDGGNIVGCTASNFGGGVYVHSGSFAMSKGSIVGCASRDCGGGVFVHGGTFDMSGGYIAHNSAINYADGVRANHQSRIMMSGSAVIDENNDLSFSDKIYVTGSEFTGSVGSLVCDNHSEGDTAVQINPGSPISAEDIVHRFGVKDYTKILVASSDGKRLVFAKASVPKVSAAALSLSTDIAVRFYVKDSSLNGYHDPYINVNFNGTEYRGILSSEDAKNERRVFVFRNISPSEMGLPIKVTLCTVKDGESTPREYGSITYSVKDYCMNQLKNSNAETNLKTLCVNLLNYGSASQIYCGEKDTAKLVNITLSKEQKNSASSAIIPAPKNDKSLSSSGDDCVGVWRAASLSLYSDISVICKFTTDTNPSNLTAVVTYGRYGENKANINSFTDSTYGSEMRPCKSLKFDKMNALELNYPIKIVLKDKYTGAVSKTLTYSVDSYAYSKIPEGGDIGNLMTHVMKYIRSIEPITAPGITIQGFGTIFVDANSKVVKNINLMNPKANDGWYYLSFKLFLLDDRGNVSEVLYESPLVEPGKCINEITLSREFDKGEYKAVLLVQPYRIYDGSPTNNAELTVKIVAR